LQLDWLMSYVMLELE